jgi:hypothetical protein
MRYIPQIALIVAGLALIVAGVALGLAFEPPPMGATPITLVTRPEDGGRLEEARLELPGCPPVVVPLLVEGGPRP